MSEVTRILSQIEHGQPQAVNELLPLVYKELRSIAARQLTAERKDHTLSPTALVHEAYLRLVADDPDVVRWHSRGHFFSAAAESMRRILVDSARRRHAAKRGGAAKRVPIHEPHVPAPEPNQDLIALDAALAQLERQQKPLADLVKLRYFAGLTMRQAAEALGVPLRTAERNWTYAKVWLLQAIVEAA